MLFGSFSTENGVTPGLPVTSTRAIGLVSTGVPPAPCFRSSTPAGDCSSVGVVVQPTAISAVAAAVRLAFRMARMLLLLSESFDERPPSWFAHVPRGDTESLLHPPVRRYRREQAAPADHRGEQDHPPVRREARRLVP